MKRKQKKKYTSSYELMKKRYPYSFYDSIMYKGAKFAGLGLKEPKIAEEYVLELFNITKDLLEGNYRIVDCLATFSDDDYGDYGEMELIKAGEWTSEGIEKWKEYYLNGPGVKKREVSKDLIDRCTLHMNLEHIKGRPFLAVDSYHVSNKKDKKKNNKYYLYHRIGGYFNNKTGEYVALKKSAWVPKIEMQMAHLH